MYEIFDISIARETSGSGYFRLSDCHTREHMQTLENQMVDHSYTSLRYSFIFFDINYLIIRACNQDGTHMRKHTDPHTYKHSPLARTNAHTHTYKHTYITRTCTTHTRVRKSYHSAVVIPYAHSYTLKPTHVHAQIFQNKFKKIHKMDTNEQACISAYIL